MVHLLLCKVHSGLGLRKDNLAVRLYEPFDEGRLLILAPVAILLILEHIPAKFVYKILAQLKQPDILVIRHGEANCRALLLLAIQPLDACHLRRDLVSSYVVEIWDERRKLR